VALRDGTGKKKRETEREGMRGDVESDAKLLINRLNH